MYKNARFKAVCIIMQCSLNIPALSAYFVFRNGICPTYFVGKFPKMAK